MTSRYGGVHQRDGRPTGHDSYESGSGLGIPSGGYRPATPNSRGQYSHAVLDELESQNDAAIEAMSAKVRMLKDITTAIGVDVRDSTTMINSMNDTFENTRFKLRGTMNRMLRMAEKTGVGWKTWLAFFGAVSLLFWYVWLF
ncbi:protein transport protein bet1 [Arthrobotrys conoides]|uniref:Protein transport protein bet1 n=1 Tax=Arthrobotrys conoides TaxID=74498 RepID=A0AAN8NMH0_9PEZI